uniref:RNA helicase n=1 Tax=Panagrolaimus sp. ES5 TaxID=591445 RepID=A0AC34GY29_9BILA
MSNYQNSRGGFTSSRGGFTSSRGGFTSSRGDNASFSRGRGFSFNGTTAPQRGSSSNEQPSFNQSSRGRTYHNSSSGQSSHSQASFVPSPTLLPNGQVEYKPLSPVHIRVTAEDKEDFGEEVEQKLINYTLPRGQAELGFAPKDRDVNTIFGEDEQHAEEYASIIDEDDEIEIIGISSELTVTVIDKWSDALFEEKLNENIARAKYVRPRKIQRSAIPIIMDQYDVCCKAETGSGKSATFLLPIIDECMKLKKTNEFSSEPFTAFAVILAPTREIAIQTFEQARKLSDGTGISVRTAYGEYNVRKNEKELARSCDIVCCTPGRFLHFVQEKYIRLHKLRFLVFDEGDKLLTDDFEKTISTALYRCDPKINGAHQTLFFSATFDETLLQRAKNYMQPNHVIIKSDNFAPTKKVVQEFRLHKTQYKFAGVRNYFAELLAKVDFDQKKLPKSFIFCKTSSYCEKLSVAMDTIHKIPFIPLSGYRGQDLREDALRMFRDGSVVGLVATDLCARGIDIKDADLVIQIDLPHDLDTYIHRVGRAGRIRHGKCISYVSLETDRLLLLQIKQAMEKSGQIVPLSLEEILRPERIQESHSPAEIPNVENSSANTANIEHFVADTSTEKVNDKAEDVPLSLEEIVRPEPIQESQPSTEMPNVENSSANNANTEHIVADNSTEKVNDKAESVPPSLDEILRSERIQESHSPAEIPNVENSSANNANIETEHTIAADISTEKVNDRSEDVPPALEEILRPEQLQESHSPAEIPNVENSSANNANIETECTIAADISTEKVNDKSEEIVNVSAGGVEKKEDENKLATCEANGDVE